MLVAWHPKRWWNLCMSEDEKKEIEPILTDQFLLSNIQLGGISTFYHKDLI